MCCCHTVAVSQGLVQKLVALTLKDLLLSLPPQSRQRAARQRQLDLKRCLRNWIAPQVPPLTVDQHILYLGIVSSPLNISHFTAN